MLKMILIELNVEKRMSMLFYVLRLHSIYDINLGRLGEVRCMKWIIQAEMAVFPCYISPYSKYNQGLAFSNGDHSSNYSILR